MKLTERLKHLDRFSVLQVSLLLLVPLHMLTSVDPETLRFQLSPLVWRCFMKTPSQNSLVGANPN